MNALEWAVSVKPDLVRLQDETGIPALWAAAQMAHESASGQGLSELARKAHNYAGLKWAEWQRKYGCSPVSFGTWEVLDGSRVDVQAAFCSCPSWEVWLKVYAALLTGNHYRPALAYNGDPALYGKQVWKLGYATDPKYIEKAMEWMYKLYDAYADTLPRLRGDRRQPVPIRDAGGRHVCDGWIEQGTTVAPVRQLAESLNVSVEWSESDHSCVLRPRA